MVQYSALSQNIHFHYHTTQVAYHMISFVLHRSKIQNSGLCEKSKNLVFKFDIFLTLKTRIEWHSEFEKCLESESYNLFFNGFGKESGVNFCKRTNRQNSIIYHSLSWAILSCIFALCSVIRLKYEKKNKQRSFGN